MRQRGPRRQRRAKTRADGWSFLIAFHPPGSRRAWLPPLWFIHCAITAFDFTQSTQWCGADRGSARGPTLMKASTLFTVLCAFSVGVGKVEHTGLWWLRFCYPSTTQGVWRRCVLVGNMPDVLLGLVMICDVSGYWHCTWVIRGCGANAVERIGCAGA